MDNGIWGNMNGYSEKTGIAELVKKYRGDVEKLNAYTSWLELKVGADVRRGFEPEDGELSLKVPVYDSNLMNFVKTAMKTQFMNRNYVYTYSKHRIRTIEDELDFIDKAGIENMQELGDILSKYILKGMQKSILWNTAVHEGVFLKVVQKMKSIVEYWTMPM